MGGGDQTPGQSGVAGDVGVDAGRQDRRSHFEGGLGGLGGEAEVPTRLEGGDVGRGHLRFLGEFLLNPIDGRLHGAGEEPGQQTEGEEVLGAEDIATADPAVLDGLLGEAVHRRLDDPEWRHQVGLEGVFLVSGLVQVALVEGFVVDDERAAWPQILQVGLEGGRVHRHQAVGSVTGGEDVVVGDLHLEGRDPGKGAGGGPDLGRKRGEGGEIVAEIGRGVGESAARDLHTVAGVAGEANDDLVDDLSVVVRCCSGDGSLEDGSVVAGALIVSTGYLCVGAGPGLVRVCDWLICISLDRHWPGPSLTFGVLLLSA